MVAKRTDGQGNASSWALSDNNGYWEISKGLPTGTYDVTAGVYAELLKGEITGYIPLKASGVKVTQVKETVNIDFLLSASGWISGKVTDSAGMPLFRAVVTANSTNGQFSGFESTDNEGFYRIAAGLNTSTYTVTAKYQTYSGSKPNISVTGGTETTAVNIQLSAPASAQVIGRVTDLASGLGFRGATVRITGPASYETLTDAKGYYSQTLGAGSYTVTALVPGYAKNTTTVQATLSQFARVYYPTATSPGFYVTKVSGSSSGKISGTVTGEANPIPEFPIAAIPVIFSIAILMIMLLASRKFRRLHKI